MSIKELLTRILNKFGSTTFTLTALKGTGYCYGTYDRASNSVRLILWVRTSESAPITPVDSIFTIPQAYRPPAMIKGACWVYTSTNARGFAYDLYINSDNAGNIRQPFSNYVTELFGVAEYNLGG